MTLADLHIHSVHSDGTLTAEEIVRRAAANHVGLLAICDHNVIEGSLTAAPLARAAGLKFLPGVELDAMLLGYDVHILCYGADFTDPALLALIRHARARLDWMSDELLRRMLKDYPVLSLAEYEAQPMDSSRGGWKLLQYLADKGVTDSIHGAYHFYTDYGVGYETAGFSPAGEIIAAIHRAGGCAILAHPGVSFKNDPELLLRGLHAALALGIDGVECHYPKHSPDLTRTLLDFCAAHSLSVTAGSDCHGAFGSADIGQTQTPIDALVRKHPALN